MSCILAYFCTRHHISCVELHISDARHEGADAREGGRYSPVHRVSGSEPLSLRTHRHVVTAAQECRCRVPASISSGLTLILREDWSCKRALETPCYARIATSPQDPTAMSPAHWSKLTWDTISAGGYDLKIQ